MADRNIEVSERIARLVDEKGGTAYYVGGFVRDRLRNADSSDIDIEVHGIAPAVLEEILDRIGKRISIGESFGIYSLCGYSVDIAMPRKEKSLGRGHRDFDISVDPAIGTLKAAERRDFTVNAMAFSPRRGVIDENGGVEDLENCVIRAVGDPEKRFSEDALRILRAVRFSCRLGFDIEEKTFLAAVERRRDLSGISNERINAELCGILLSENSRQLEKTLLGRGREILFEIIQPLEQHYHYRMTQYLTTTYYEIYLHGQ